jgi:hypothetical protein
MKQIQITMQEIWSATRPSVQKTKKQYDRKKAKKEFEKIVKNFSER